MKTSVTSAVLGEQWQTPGPADLIFPKWQRELFKTVLNAENLRFANLKTQAPPQPLDHEAAV
jgi:hypothetical protein